MNQMTRLTAASDEKLAGRFTTAEFLRMADCGAFDGLRVELIDGVMIRMQQPRSNHAMRQAKLILRLAPIVGEDRICGEIGIDLGDDTVLGCDVAVLRTPLADNRMLRPDDVALVIEVAETTLGRDRGIKRQRYAAGDVPVYWVVDANRSVVHVHAEPVDGEYVDIHTVRFGQPLAVPGTDGTITLD